MPRLVGTGVLLGIGLVGARARARWRSRARIGVRSLDGRRYVVRTERVGDRDVQTVITERG